MATNILETKISGRLGRYTVRVIDRNDSVGTLGSLVELENDVVISWGEQKSQSVNQIIKSFTELSFVDPELELHKTFRGEIDPLQFYVDIQGPGVHWRGNIKSENRGVPFSGRVRQTRTNLRVFGGLKKMENKEAQTGASGTGIGSALVKASVFAENILVRTDVQVIDQGGNFHDVGQGIEPSDKDIVLYNGGDLYESLVSFADMTKGIAYKSLSENSIVYDSARLLGSSGIFDKREGTGSTSDFNRQPYIKNVNIDDIIIDGGGGQSGLDDLDRVGTIEVSLDKEHNLMTEGGSFKVANASDTGVIHDAAEVQDLFTPTDWEKRSGRFMLINVAPGVTGTVNTEIGKISPSKDIRIALDWKLGNGTSAATDPTSLNIELRYRGNSGAVVSETSGTSTFQLQGPLTSKEIDPIIIMDVEAGEVQIRARYVDSDGNVIESLVANKDEKGLDNIPIDEWNYAFSESIYFSNVAVNAKNVLIGDLNIVNVQPFLVRAAVEDKYRPFGVQTAKGKLIGLYGPEYCFRIDEDEQKIFVPVARKCNLTTGTTEFTDVEIPVHTLLP